MNPTRSLRLRSLPLAPVCALALLAASARAQNCTGTISASVSQVSISTGGVQNITLDVAPGQAGLPWQIVGAYGTNHPIPWLAYGNLRLNNDRYLYRTYSGHRGFLQGVVPGYIGGPLVPFNSQGQAQVQVVIPPGLPSIFIGRTLHHGMYRISPDTLLPECGTGTVPLTLVP